MPCDFKNMNPFKTTLRDGRPADDGNAAALNEIGEGSDQGSSAPSDTGELQLNQTINSESDCCDTEEPAGSRGNNPDEKGSEFEALCAIQGVRETQDRLKKGLDVLKINYQRDNMVILEALQEDQLRCDALEQQLTDLTEFFQREIVNLKEELSSTKENMNYRTRENTDFNEALEACHTRLLNVELQQQQEVQVELPEDTTAWVVLRKMISVLLVVLTAILVFVSTLSHFVILFKPSGHMLSALFFAILLYFIWKYWDSL